VLGKLLQMRAAANGKSRSMTVDSRVRPTVRMKTRQNGVADEPRCPPLDTVHRRGTTGQTCEGICDEDGTLESYQL